MMQVFTAWLDSLSALPLALFFCSLLLAVTLLGILLVYPLMRRLLHGRGAENEVVVYAAGSFGVIYAVLMGLLTVAAFERTKAADDAIGREASSLATIYRSADGYPEPLRNDLKAGLRDYTHYVIQKDWPAHRQGIVPVGGEHRLAVIRQAMLDFEPTTKTQEVLHGEMLRYLNEMTDAREQRMSVVSGAIPAVLWYVVAIGALITIAFLWMVNTSLLPQLLFGGITAIFLGFMIFLVYAMDHPLQGAISMGPDDYEQVYQVVMKWDDAA